jgi:hypothetical protein
LSKNDGITAGGSFFVRHGSGTMRRDSGAQAGSTDRDGKARINQTGIQ